MDERKQFIGARLKCDTDFAAVCRAFDQPQERAQVD